MTFRLLATARVLDLPEVPDIGALCRDRTNYGRTVRVDEIDPVARRVTFTTVTTSSGQTCQVRRSSSTPIHAFSRRYTPIPEGAAPCPEQ